MSIINLTDTGKPKLNDLAAKAVLSGVRVEYINKVRRTASNGTRYTAYHFMTTSRSVKERVYDTYLWHSLGDNVWFGECSPDAEDNEACTASRLGGKCCTHLAVSLAELKAEKDRAIATVNNLTDEELEKIKQEVFEG